MTHACQLEDFGSQILENGGDIDGCLGANTHFVLGVRLEETLDTTTWELKRWARWSVTANGRKVRIKVAWQAGSIPSTRPGRISKGVSNPSVILSGKFADGIGRRKIFEIDACHALVSRSCRESKIVCCGGAGDATDGMGEKLEGHSKTRLGVSGGWDRGRVDGIEAAIDGRCEG